MAKHKQKILSKKHSLQCENCGKNGGNMIHIKCAIDYLKALGYSVRRRREYVSPLVYLGVEDGN